MVFFLQLPRFTAALAAAAVTDDDKGDALGAGARAAALSTAKALAAASADAAWDSRLLPPFSKSDVCDAPTQPPTPAGAPPKFTWDWAAAPAGGGLFCADSRTQASALALFVGAWSVAQM